MQEPHYYCMHQPPPQLVRRHSTHSLIGQNNPRTYNIHSPNHHHQLTTLCTPPLQPLVSIIPTFTTPPANSRYPPPASKPPANNLNHNRNRNHSYYYCCCHCHNRSNCQTQRRKRERAMGQNNSLMESIVSGTNCTVSTVTTIAITIAMVIPPPCGL